MTLLCWRPVKDTEFDRDALYMPSKRRKPIDVLLDFDLFTLTDEAIDVVLAVVASTGHTRFFYETSQPKRRRRYLSGLNARGREAAKLYEKELRYHFKKYSYEFREGYSLPEPPTPQLRAIYNSAATWENRPRVPCGTTLQSGFSLGEYHWRKWPLSNFIDQNDLTVAK